MADEVNATDRTTASFVVSFYKELEAGGIPDNYAGEMALDYARVLFRGEINIEVIGNV